MLIASALRKDNVIYTGKRHCDIFIQRPMGELRNAEQGFIDEDGNFYNRKDAEVYARNCGQLTKQIIDGELTSEDLW